MKAYELLRLMIRICDEPEGREREVRIGDQVEAGPYSHASVGGIFRGRDGEVILCANDDEKWRNEDVTNDNLETLWPPPSSREIG